MSAPLTRLGLHYFPDTLHYRQEDVKQWLPVWQDLRLSWLVLYATTRFSIPEAFLNTLVTHSIQPVIHLHSPLDPPASISDFALLFKMYARWGVRHIVLFDRPNMKQSWTQSEWVRASPVNRFLDIWIPRAEAALQAGLLPVMPPLEPGGDYWDTIFLEGILHGLQQRNQRQQIQQLNLSAYAFTDPDHLSRGRGGPEQWPASIPYSSSDSSQNHIGFHTFEWYLEIAERITGIRPPTFLLQAGAPLACLQSPTAIGQAKTVMSILKSLLPVPDPIDLSELDPLPPEIVACSFWLLAAEAGTRHEACSWYSAPGLPKPSLQYPISWLRQYAPISEAPNPTGMNVATGSLSG